MRIFPGHKAGRNSTENEKSEKNNDEKAAGIHRLPPDISGPYNPFCLLYETIFRLIS